MNGKVCVVTGATSGIGKATATALARQGAQVVLVGRDRGRSEATAAELAKVTASPPQVEIADLSSMAQVRALADRLNAMDRIDVLINNAGIRGWPARDDRGRLRGGIRGQPPRAVPADEPAAGQADRIGAGRVITVTSDAHTAAKLDLDDLQLERGWDSWRSYSNSKLANILFTRELARRTAGTGVTANCAHPGVVRSGFGRDASPLLRIGLVFARPFLLSPERGASTVVYLASLPDVVGRGPAATT